MVSREKILALARPVLDEKKFFLVSLTISSTNKIVLRVDGMEGVKIEDCVKISRVIEQGLDREEEDFELEVSSAGLDSSFMVKEQYQKNVGRNIVMKFPGGIKLEGKLIEANEEDFVVEYQRKEKIEGRKKKQTITETKTYKYQQVNDVKLVMNF
jgi:ribosome maturation factor RimP